MLATTISLEYFEGTSVLYSEAPLTFCEVTDLQKPCSNYGVSETPFLLIQNPTKPMCFLSFLHHCSQKTQI